MISVCSFKIRGKNTFFFSIWTSENLMLISQRRSSDWEYQIKPRQPGVNSRKLFESLQKLLQTPSRCQNSPAHTDSHEMVPRVPSSILPAQPDQTIHHSCLLSRWPRAARALLGLFSKFHRIPHLSTNGSVFRPGSLMSILQAQANFKLIFNRICMWEGWIHSSEETLILKETFSHPAEWGVNHFRNQLRKEVL